MEKRELVHVYKNGRKRKTIIYTIYENGDVFKQRKYYNRLTKPVECKKFVKENSISLNVAGKRMTLNRLLWKVFKNDMVDVKKGVYVVKKDINKPIMLDNLELMTKKEHYKRVVNKKSIPVECVNDGKRYESMNELVKSLHDEYDYIFKKWEIRDIVSAHINSDLPVELKRDIFGKKYMKIKKVKDAKNDVVKKVIKIENIKLNDKEKKQYLKWLKSV